MYHFLSAGIPLFIPCISNLEFNNMINWYSKTSKSHFLWIGDEKYGNILKLILCFRYILGPNSKHSNRHVLWIKWQVDVQGPRQRVASLFSVSWERCWGRIVRVKTLHLPSSMTAWDGNECFGLIRALVRNYFVFLKYL